MSNDHIKDFWEKQAEVFGTSYEASWGDYYMIELELETIGKYIGYRQSVLDVGCANGYSTSQQAMAHLSCKFVGIDYAENFISAAKKTSNMDNIEFLLGDARAIQFADNTFDVVYTTRVLINLPTWSEQTQAIKECIRVAKPGGTIIFSEAFWEPMELLNAMRMLKGLDAITMHDFNRYLKLSGIKGLLKSLNLTFHIEDFSSIYYLGTRFLKQLIAGPESYVSYKDEINKAFYELEKKFSGGGMGIQQAVIITK